MGVVRAMTDRSVAADDRFDDGPTVGVVGVGTIGDPIARQIAGAFETIAFDIDTDQLTSIADAGVEAAADPTELGRRSDVVLLSLPSSDAVEAATLGDDGVLGGLSEHDVLVDTSTIDPETTESVAAACEDRDVEFLDIPVSGGPRNAEKGALTAMAGGDADVLELIAPVLESFCETIYHVGGQGTGIAMKLANNYLLAVNAAAVCEALLMARRAGIDDETFFDVASSASGDSYALRRNLEGFVLPGEYDPEADLSIVQKDARLAEGLGRELGVPLLVGGSTSSIYRLAEEHGLADRDFAALLALYDPEEDVGSP